MKRITKAFLAVILTVNVYHSPKASADMFGGDVAVLLQIYANAIQQLLQLKEILSTGTDTLDLLRDINRGIRDGLAAIRMIYPKFDPGIFGSLELGNADIHETSVTNLVDDRIFDRPIECGATPA